MNRKGVLPNSRTWNIIVNSLISREETDEAYRVFRRMINVCDPDADTYIVMIKLFCENDKLEMAMKVWKYIQLKQFVHSVHTFYVLISGLYEKGEVSNACIFLEEMIEKGIRPSRLIFGKLRQLFIKEKREDVLEILVQLSLLGFMIKCPIAMKNDEAIYREAEPWLSDEFYGCHDLQYLQKYK
ncbi:hypothetical protein GIB67_040993 [Kingdonia uniflora]|uniref:Pentatricopeptide repeat-containing protein n=1 Tax=Kingdonia uniflora TaxID=39325 RepID=A0A7J7NBX1_9MAGN|nr:hypothetical protein GIB67_040993 [Kingdonia uniflora]